MIYTLDAWSWRLDSGRLDAGPLDNCILGLWTTGRLDSVLHVRIPKDLIVKLIL